MKMANDTGGAGVPEERADATCVDSTTEIAGERVVLLAERALYWPAGGALVIADPHFGKAASFRAHGIPVPRGTTTETLDRLAAAIARSGAARLIVLGDFLHHRTGRAEATFAALAAWRGRHPRLAVDLVPGNHDAHAGPPPAALGFTAHPDAIDVGPFRFAHAPARVTGRHVIAGHVHPAYVLRGRRESVRLPCFVVGAHGTILPAFGAFTGAHPVRPAADERVFVLAEHRVLAIGGRPPA